ncbi:hypothetical protein [Streptodolium elevatio]
MSPQRSRRIAARLAATTGAAAAMSAAVFLTAPTAGASTPSTGVAVSSAVDASPAPAVAATAAPSSTATADESAVAEQPTRSPGELGAKRVSSAPGKSVYVTEYDDNITVSSEAGSPSATIRTAGGGWVGVLAPGRNGPLASPTSGWHYLLVDDGHPYVDMRYGNQSGRIEVPAAPAPANPRTVPDARTATDTAAAGASGADSGTVGDTSSRGTAGLAAGSTGSGAPSPAAATSGRGLWPSKSQAASGATDGTNLILYSGGALIAAVAVAGVGFAVVRRDPDGRF